MRTTADPPHRTPTTSPTITQVHTCLIVTRRGVTHTWWAMFDRRRVAYFLDQLGLTEEAPGKRVGDQPQRSQR